MTARVWHKGPPPHVGWWNASACFDLTAWRWWDGEQWSVVAYNFDNARAAIDSVTQKSCIVHSDIEWTNHWPKGARVPRINPETGKVTGGAS